MCKWGECVPLLVVIPAHLSHTGESRIAEKMIDRCIAPIVKALNAGGIQTIASCCGHGKTAGEIVLADGRKLLVINSTLKISSTSR